MATFRDYIMIFEDCVGRLRHILRFWFGVEGAVTLFSFFLVETLRLSLFKSSNFPFS